MSSLLLGLYEWRVIDGARKRQRSSRHAQKTEYCPTIIESLEVSNDRRFRAFSDPLPAISSSSSLCTSNLSSCPTNLDRLSSTGRVSSTAYRLMLTAALECQFTNPVHFLPLVERTSTPPPPSFSSLAFLRSIVSEKRIFPFFVWHPMMTGLEDPRIPSLCLPLRPFNFFKMNALHTHLL